MGRTNRASNWSSKTSTPSMARMQQTSSCDIRKYALSAPTSTTKPSFGPFLESRSLLRRPPATVTRRTVVLFWTRPIKIYNIFLSMTKGAACSIVRRFAGKTLVGGSGHGKHARAALRETYDICLREALRAGHAKMHYTRLVPGQQFVDFSYELDTRRERLNSCDPPEGPTDR